MKKAENELHSFPFCEEVDGIEHNYRITESPDHTFGVEKDGLLIAEISNDSEWRQKSGEALDERLLQKICDRIRDRYT